MGQTLDNFAEALKIDYLPVIREQLNNSSAFLVTVQRNEKDVTGKQWQLTAHYQRNTGVGAGSETNLPAAGNQAYKNPYGNVRYNRGRIQISGRFIKLGPPIEQSLGTITFLNSVDLLGIGQYRANCIYAEV